MKILIVCCALTSYMLVSLSGSNVLPINHPTWRELQDLQTTLQLTTVQIGHVKPLAQNLTSQNIIVEKPKVHRERNNEENYVNAFIDNGTKGNEKIVWSPLQILDTQNNSKRTLEILQETFNMSGFPRSNKTLQWDEWHEDIVFTYPHFHISVPQFVDDHDKDLFYRNEDYQQQLTFPMPSQLVGKIRVIKNGSAETRYNCGWKSDLQKFMVPGNTGKYADDILIPILTPEGNSFQHFIDGALPKIIQALPFVRLAGVKLALEKTSNPMIHSMLEEMQLMERIVWVVGGKVSARIQINTCITPPIHPLLWAGLRQQLHVRPRVHPSAAKVVLIHRRHTYNGGRETENAGEVERFLAARYGAAALSIYNQSVSTLAATRQVFGAARIIIGVHGGALYNINFAPAHCAVVEVMPTYSDGSVPARLAHTIIWRMAHAIGQPYWRLPQTPTQGTNVVLPIEKLSYILDRIDQAS
jgi:hypothetical protein